MYVPDVGFRYDFQGTIAVYPAWPQLPHTRFAFYPGNDIERIFTGGMPVVAAHRMLFSKGQLIQQLIHHLKYHGNKTIHRHLPG